MKTFTFKAHSLIDVITNSSTEIYTYIASDGVQKTYELLNTVMKACGSPRKAEGLFDVSVVLDDEDSMWDKLTDQYDIEDHPEWLNGFYEVGDGWRERNVFWTETVLPRIEALGSEWKQSLIDDYIENQNDYDNVSTSLRVTAKDGSTETTEMFERFQGIFCSEEGNN